IEYDIANFQPFLMSATPIRIVSIELKSDDSYSTNLSSNLSVPDNLYIELIGTDGDESNQDTTNVYVINEATLDSISIKLIETSINTGIYRGLGYTGQVTDNQNDIIGITGDDIVTVVSIVDASIKISAQVDINNPPSFTTTSLDDATEDVAYSFTVEATDPDHVDDWTFEILMGPNWLAIETIDTLGVLSGTPANIDVGIDIHISIRVEDSGGLSDTLNTTINIINVNDDPVIIACSPALDTVITEGDSVLFSVTTQDVDNDSLYYTWFLDETIIHESILPIPDSTSTVYLHFPVGSKGVHSVKVLVSDGESSADTTWSITVDEILSEADEPIIVTLPEDVSSFTVNFTNNASISLNFTSGDIANSPLTIKQISSITESFPDVPDFENAVNYYDISLDVESFEAELTFGYDESMVTGMGISEDSLAISFYDSTDVRGYIWHSLPATIDKDNNTVTVTTEHLSLWAITSKEEGLITDVETQSSIASEYALFQNYPNPFNPETTIRFELPRLFDVSIRVYDILGREVKTLMSQRIPAGQHSVTWDGTNNFRHRVSSGMYIYKLQAGEYSAVKKMLFIK
ncbi:FlgD immunoglobulin-like domain containing protein, partial [candidate division KSB1 bacterium]